MTSDKKIASNRSNAQKSTGPTSPGGKSIARLNPLKNGLHASSQLLPGENTAAFETLTVDVFATYQPVGPIEQAYAEQIRDLLWRLKRLKAVDCTELRRTQISIVLDDRAKQNGQLLAAHDDIDRALRETLAHEEEMRLLTEKESRSNTSGTVDASSTPVDMKIPLPEFTFWLAYASCNHTRQSDEIERKIDATTRRLMRLHEAIERMQARRLTNELPTIESE